MLLISIYSLLFFNLVGQFATASSCDDSSIKQEKWSISNLSTQYISFEDLLDTGITSTQTKKIKDEDARTESEEDAVQKISHLRNPKNITPSTHLEPLERLSSISLSSHQNSEDRMIYPFSSSDKKSNQTNNYDCCEFCLIS
ncbi:MAG: hypothetical protein C0432_04380 [Candidatus Puniceispirillum sp.]|nr:hypothetical protein [Candidatus Pelagibacter sp.]MBA4283512.1 hypothetical protein [Candidatus Puniceispirillum sp.]